MPDLKGTLLFAAFLVLPLVASAQAQPDTPSAANPRAAASGAGPGSGRDGRGMMHGRWGRSYTPGWSMMTPQEREQHRKRMWEARTPAECRAIRDEHRKLMDERAKERGLGPMRGPRHDACEGWGRGS